MGVRLSAAGRLRTPSAAAPRAARTRRSSGWRSRCFASDGLEVGVLKGRGKDTHAVDVAPGPDQLGDEPRHVLAGALVDLRPLVRLDLDPARSAQLRRRALAYHLTAQQDHDAVADELDLAQQVRIEQDRGATALQLLQQLPHRAPAHRGERAPRVVTT